MAHARKPDFVFRRNGRVHLNRQGASVQSTAGSWGVRISGSNVGYTMFRGSVKSTGYPFHSLFSPSLPLPCLTVCHHISNTVYLLFRLRGDTCQRSWAFWIKKSSYSSLKQNFDLSIIQPFYSRPRADTECQTQTKCLVLHRGTSHMNSCRFFRMGSGSDVSTNKCKMNRRMSP
jgi:hypothetical protein